MSETNLAAKRAIPPAERFSNRVENYLRYRPHYPGQLLELLQEKCGLVCSSIIADVGSGTGFLTELFLSHGNRVFGIEPNSEMRQAGERLLERFPNFTSVAASAECTTLPQRSVDFITAAQAFHWFDPERCGAEFRRILRPAGWVILIWNDRRLHSSAFLRDYEQFLRAHGTDYSEVDHKLIDAAVLRRFFGSEPTLSSFPNYQHLDFAGLQGRVLSASYMPNANDPGFLEMIEALRFLFDKHQREDKVTLEYDTKVYYGRLTQEQKLK